MVSLFKRKQLLEPSDAINQVVALHIAPILKEKGFKKLGRTWVKDLTDYSFIINVQASRWNNSDVDAAFTINYGIYVPSIYPLLFGNQKPKSPKEYDCVLRKRVVESNKKEIWWNAYNYDDITKLGQEIELEVTNQCLGFFGKIRSLVDILSLVQPSLAEGAPWSLLAGALIYAELGNTKQADAYFKQAYQISSDNPPFQSKIEAAAKEFGINI